MSWNVEVQTAAGWVPLDLRGSSLRRADQDPSHLAVSRFLNLGTGQHLSTFPYLGNLNVTIGTSTAGVLEWNLEFNPTIGGHYRLAYEWDNITVPIKLSTDSKQVIVDYGYDMNYTFSWADVPSTLNTTVSVLSNRFKLFVDLGDMAAGSDSKVDPTIASSTSPSATAWPFQRKVFFEPTGGYYFAFYFDGGTEGWSSSRDGVNWSPKGAMPNGWPGFWDASVSGPSVLNFGQTVVIASGGMGSAGCSGNCAVGVTVRAVWAQGTISGGQITWQPDGTGAYTRQLASNTPVCNGNGASCTITAGYRYVTMGVASDSTVALSYNYFFYLYENDYCGYTPYTGSYILAQYKGPQPVQPSGLATCGRVDLSNQDRSIVLAADAAANMRLVYYYEGTASTPSLISIHFDTTGGWNAMETIEGSVLDDPSFSGVSDSAFGNHVVYKMPDGTIKSAERRTRDTSWTTYTTDIFGGPALYPTITVDASNDDLFALAVSGQSVLLRSKTLTGSWYDRQVSVAINRPTSIAYLSSGAVAVGATNSSWISTIWTEQSPYYTTYTVMFGAIPIPTVWSPFASSSSPWDGNGIVPFGQYFSNLGEYVSPSTGMLTVKQTDLSVPGRGLSLDLARVYTEPPTFLNGSPFNVETPYGFRDDTFTSGWSQLSVGTVNSLSEGSNGDVLSVTFSPGSAGDDYRVWARYGLTIDTNLYPYLVAKWMTSAACCTGLGVGIGVVFTDGSGQILQPTDNTAFSSTWTTRAYSLPAGKIVKEIDLYNNDNPNSLSSGTYTVSWDYVAAVAPFIVGNGWQLNFPSMSSVAQPSYIHLWDGQGYRIPVSFWNGLTATFENHQGTSFRLVRYQDGTVILSTSSGTTYHFNTSHRLSAITDATGNNTITLSYDSSSRVSSILDTLQRVFLFCYDSNLPMELRTIYQTTSTGTCNGSGATRSIQYAYNDRLSLASVTDPGGRVTTFSYNYPIPAASPWLPTQITYPTQWASTYSYIASNLGSESLLYTYRVLSQTVNPNSGTSIRSAVYVYTKGAGDQIIGSSVLTYNGTSSSGPGSGPIAIDGSVIAGCSHTTMLCSATLSTGQPNDIVIVFTTESLDLEPSCIFGISDTAGLTWSVRSPVVYGNSNRDQLQEWWAPSANVLSSDVITESISGCNENVYGGEYNGLLAFAVSGANLGNPFDPNAGLPGVGSGNSQGSSVTISTSNSRDMVIAGVQLGNTVPTPQSGFTIISSCGGCATDYGTPAGPLTNFAVTFGSTSGGNWEEIADAIQPAALPLVSYTDYSFSFAGMTRNVSDANHRLISGVQQRFGIHGEVIREINLVTGSNVWYWTKHQPGSGWNAQLNWPLSAWSLTPVVQSFGGAPWGNIAGWQDTTAKWIWWNPDAATSSTTEPVWFRTTFTVPIASSINIEATTDDSFTLYIDGNQYLSGNNWQVRYVATGIPLQSGSHVIAVSAGNMGGPAGLILSLHDASTNQVIVRTDTSVGSYTNSYRYDLWGNLIYSHLAIDPSSNSYQDNFYAYYNDGILLGYYYFLDSFSDSEGNAANNPEWSKDFVMPDKTPDPCCTVRMSRDNMGVVNGKMHFDVDGYPVSFYFYSPQIPISGAPPHWLVSFDWIANSTTSASTVTNMDLQLKFSNGTRIFVSQLVAGGSLGASGSYSSDLGGIINNAIAHGNTWAELVWHIEDGWDVDYHESGDITNVKVSPGTSFSNSFMNGFAPGPPGLNTWLYTKTPPSGGWNSVTNWSTAGSWTPAPAVLDFNSPSPPWGPRPGFVDTNAQWIWWNKNAWSTSTQDPVWFRRVFYVPSTLTMNIEMTADNAYWLYLDGNSIDYNQDWTTRKTYGLLLTPGYHVLAIEAVNFGCCNPAGLLLSASNSATGQILFHTDGVAGQNIVALAGQAAFQAGSTPFEAYLGYTSWGAIAQTQRRYDTVSGPNWVSTLSTYDGQFGNLKTYSDPMGNLAYLTYSSRYQNAFLTNQTQGLAFSLSSSFNNGTYAGWTVSTGSWTVLNGELSSSGTGDEDISAGQTSWALNLVQSRVKILSGQDVSIDFLWDGGGNHYRMQTWDAYQTLRLYKSQAGVYTQLAYSTLSGIVGSRWHTWGIAVSGGTIRLFIDGVQYIQYTDPSPYTTGKVRLRTLNTQVHYDDVSISMGKAATSTVYGYDLATSGLLNSTDARGSVTSYQYDILGRSTRVNYPTSSEAYTLTLQGYDYDGAGEETLTLNGNLLASLPKTNSPQNAGIYVSFNVNMTSLVVKGTNTLTFTHAPWDCGVTDNTKNVQVFSNNVLIFSDPAVHPLSCTQSITYVFTAGTDYLAYAYNDQANYVNSTNENGWKTQQIYDGLGRLITTERFLNGAPYANQTSAYNGMNQATTRTDALGNRFTYQYDAVGRISTTTKPDGNSTWAFYNTLASWARFSDEYGNQRCAIYDRLGRLISVIEKADYNCQAGIVTNYFYDLVGDLTKVTNANQQSTSYAYDNLKRLTQKSFADGTTEAYAYDNIGNAVKKVDQNGLNTLLSYDTLNRPTTISYCGSQVTSQSYTYDSNGNIVSLQNQNATVSYSYDARNRVLNETDSINPSTRQVVNIGCSSASASTTGGISRTYTVAFTYAGETVSTIAYPTTTGTSQDITVGYAYDTLGRVLNVTRLGTSTYYARTFTYYKNDQMKGFQFGNNLIANYTYDRLSRPLTTSLTGTTTMNLVYGYNKTGTVSSVTGQVNGAAVNEQYKHDSLQRLTNATVTSSSGSTRLWYQYDNVGNRLAQSVNGTITAYTYNLANNELTGSSKSGTTVTYAYDKNGNLLNKNETTGGTVRSYYTWDASNHLLKATNGTGQVLYAYDALGRRVESIEGGSTSYFEYIGTDILYKNLLNTSNNAYIYAAGLKICVVVNVNWDIYYYHTDSLGSTRIITYTDSTYVYVNNYQPFGQDNGTAKGVYANRATDKFTGKPYSKATGLYYEFQRWYDPSIGRFISPDRIAGYRKDPQSLNPYIYVENSPTNSIDPSGLDCFSSLSNFGSCAGNLLYDNTVGAAVNSYNWYQGASDADRRAFWIGLGVAVLIGVAVGASCVVAACAGLWLLGIGALTGVAGSVWAADVYRLAGGQSEGGVKASLFWGGIGAGLGFGAGSSGTSFLWNRGLEQPALSSEMDLGSTALRYRIGPWKGGWYSDRPFGTIGDLESEFSPLTRSFTQNVYRITAQFAPDVRGFLGPQGTTGAAQFLVSSGSVNFLSMSLYSLAPVYVMPIVTLAGLFTAAAIPS